MTEVKAAEFNFSVAPKTAENQINKEKTYFDLLLQPGQEALATVDLRNDTDKEVIIEAQINSATTNGNGVVEYSENDLASDETLKYKVEDYVEAPEEIVLKANSVAEYKMKLRMPDKSFDGIIAGGITFKEKKKGTSATISTRTDGKGLAIKNEYFYVIALLMRQTTANGSPDLKLTSAYPAQRNARNVIKGVLQNSNATYLNQLAVKTTITKKDDSKILYTNEQSQMQVAPNTHFALSVPLNGEHLQAGKYTMNMEAYGEKMEAGSYPFRATDSQAEENFRYHWSLEKDFEIKVEEAKKLNSSDVTIKNDYPWLYILIGILLLLSIILFVIWQRKQSQKKVD
ncbi:LPXTG-domain-containing protein cell wall anchor domain [Enterococcus hermanniensis]|uniref:LPXTG-domain-containing protein cell wall anchor domain n=2 Tax=Enterococcus hermanniensis TaxID=249189 RepID=A0A1L8TPN7_9ENTE|nr:LPXTG-domain-containing protein cell wall anchor domain [Enterococcus hermanniensis]